jgi:hypothetical protein
MLLVELLLYRLAQKAFQARAPPGGPLPGPHSWTATYPLASGWAAQLLADPAPPNPGEGRRKRAVGLGRARLIPVLGSYAREQLGYL